jgi:hypothetical protein
MHASFIEGADGAALTWSYSHNGGGRIEVAVEFLAGGVWVPLISFDSCLSSTALPLHHIRGAERLRVVVTDGWRSSSEELDVPEGVHFGPVVIRRVTDRLFFAQAEPAVSVQWDPAAGGTARGNRILFSTAFAGKLTLRAQLEGGVTLVDSRVLG